MKTSNRKIAGVLALAITGGGLFLGTTSASAATVPPWEPDANSYGSLSFYDAAGNQVTSGSNLNHLFDYAVASTPSARSTTKATLYIAFPNKSLKDSSEWYVAGAGGPTTFPIANAPGDVASAGNKPVVAAKASDANLNAAIGGAVLDTNPGYANIVQIRLKDSGAGAPQETSFWSTDISYDQSTGKWSQLYPAVVPKPDVKLVADPDPSTVGDTVTLSATVTSGGAGVKDGTVQFKDGGANLGSPVTPNASGVATTTTSSLAQGSHSLSAVFTPTDPTAYKSATGTFTATVNPAATKTVTTASVSGDYTNKGAAATLTATVKQKDAGTAVTAGSVAFYDNGTKLSGDLTSTDGTFTYQVPSGFAVGSHSIVAKFTPTYVRDFAASQSDPQAFVTEDKTGPCGQPGAQCVDPQTVQATVPVGTLVIDTPYTPANPLDLGTLKLSDDSSKFTGAASFNNIKVTDTRSGNLGWEAKALAGPLTNGKNGVINGQNLGLDMEDASSVVKGAGFAGTVKTFDNLGPASPVAAGDTGSLGLGGATAHTIASADKGLGTVTMRGTLILQAPSSTEAGLYTGTITFTVG